MIECPLCKATVHTAVTLDIPLHKAIERILDDHSAWIARPNDEVTRAIAKLAIIAVHEIISEREALSAAPAVGGEAPIAMVAAAQKAILDHPHFCEDAATAFGFANAAVKAALAQPASPLRGREVISDAIMRVVSNRDDLGYTHFIEIRDAVFAALDKEAT